VLALALVAGCADNERGGRADAKICTPFAAQPANAADPAAAAAAAAAPGGEAAAFDDCLHRWAYRLARSEDDRADFVAQATVAACQPLLARWNQATLGAQPPGTPDSAVSLVTGRTNNTPADRFEGAQSKALFYVVQARAGNCAPPP
jgi:hypothetical protein